MQEGCAGREGLFRHDGSRPPAMSSPVVTGRSRDFLPQPASDPMECRAVERTGELKFRDSLAVMDSRFRGNDVMIEREPSLPPTTTVTPAVSVTRLLHQSKDPLLPRSHQERAPRKGLSSLPQQELTW